ncbi:MAG TPA: MscL family protein, partial [Chthonomonadales bacterium]|nr:MscL family protein [Chthonomonadales bacterium]
AFSVNGSKFLIGDFLNAVIAFVLIAVTVFFFVVRPVNWLMTRRDAGKAAEPANRECPFCCSSIPVKATRCAFCTSEVQAA